MKFLLDMGISPRVVSWLQQNGHAAVHFNDIKPTASDTEILQMAQEEKAVILTADKDFCELLALRGLTSPSVILFRLTPAPAEEVIRRLAPVLVAYPEELDQGCLITIALGKPRLRLLPIRR